MATTATDPEANGLSDQDWERINARGAESAARQRQERERPKYFTNLRGAPSGGEHGYRRTMHRGQVVYVPIVEPPSGEITPSGFKNGVVR